MNVRSAWSRIAGAILAGLYLGAAALAGVAVWAAWLPARLHGVAMLAALLWFAVGAGLAALLALSRTSGRRAPLWRRAAAAPRAGYA